ncbi:MAG: alpha/beta fold hydrolase [Lachnospiraceae bacterium]|nr:alpha/beta fold hydrolase [Lachnospiraceae bacterium]
MLTKSDLLGESDYLPAMEGPVAAWLRDTVLSGNLSSFDDTALRYYYAIPEGAKGIVLMVHGLSEFFGKYHEMAWYFYRSGFGFFFLEQRGHGYSGGKLPDAADIVVIDDFRTYMKDLKCFYDRIVDPRSEGLPKVIFAHSMGGAVSALFLENYPGLFKGAVFSSPMFRLSTGGQGPVVVLAVKTFVKLTGRMELPGPGQHRFDRTPVFETSSALSKARYDYLFRQRLEDSHYQTYAASYAWIFASIEVGKRLMKGTGKLTLPMTIFTAGQDKLIDPEGYAEFAKRVPKAVFVHYESSRHEIYNADDDVRIDYYEKLLLTLDQYLS